MTLTDQQQQIIAIAQLTRAPFSTASMSAIGLHDTAKDFDLLYTLDLIEDAPIEGRGMALLYVLTPKGYAFTDFSMTDPAPVAPDLTDLQYRVMRFAMAHGRFNVTDMWRHISEAMPKSELDPLLEAGLLQRLPAAVDSVLHRYELTEAGVRYLAGTDADKLPDLTFTLHDRMQALLRDWQGQLDGEAFDPPTTEAVARLAMLRACTDDLERALIGGDV